MEIPLPRALTCGALAWNVIRNASREHPRASEAEVRFIAAMHAAEDGLGSGLDAAPWLGYFRHRSTWCMCLGWMFFNEVFDGLLTWMPTYLYKAHGFDLKALGGASFVIFFSGFIGEPVGGALGDAWLARGGPPNLVFRTLFGIAAAVTTASIFSVALLHDECDYTAL